MEVEVLSWRVTNLKSLAKEERRIAPEWGLIHKYIGYIPDMQWWLVVYPIGTEITIAHPAMIVKRNMAAVSVPSVIVVSKTEKKLLCYNILLEQVGEIKDIISVPRPCNSQ